MLKISHQFQNPTSTLSRGEGGAREEYFSNDAYRTRFEQSVPRPMARVVALERKNENIDAIISFQIIFVSLVSKP